VDDHTRRAELVAKHAEAESKERLLHRYEDLATAGGSEIQSGWLKDKFGLSWQIVPARLPELVKNPKAMQAMLQMKKLDIAELERAAQS
jgi:predicted 3-demethylubiquinone-9 3-methyltransferase (glyoxalase superfamily)